MFSFSDGRQTAIESVALPMPAVRLLAEILSQMAQGNAVTLIPIHAELTTQQAADLLNVSRPFLIKLLEQQRLPFRKVGKHRRVRFSDVLGFKQHSDEQRRAALQRLAAEGQERIWATDLAAFLSAAAIRARADVIVTANVRDFPAMRSPSMTSTPNTPTSLSGI